MKKIRILYIVTRLDRGGSSAAILQSSMRFNSQRFEISIMFGVSKEADEELVAEAKEKGIRFIFNPHLIRNISVLEDIPAFISIFLLIKSQKFDIIHTHTSKAGILGRIAARLAKNRNYQPIVIHTPHGHIFYGYYGSVLSKFFLMLETWAGGFTDRIITLTERGIDEHLQFGVGKNRSKFTAIPDGVDTGKIKNLKIDPAQKRKELGFQQNAVLIGSAGRLEPIKGYKYFIEASVIIKKVFPECIFVLIGDGALRSELEEQIRKSGLENNFRILGWRNDVEEIISILDIFVLSSINEGMGRVIVEAMALGKPVIATSVGGIPSVVVDKETGLLVPQGNAGKMAEAIIYLLNNPEKYRQMGEKGKERAGLFSMGTMAEKTMRLYEELLAAKK